jgi:S-formylglutathione hydrolase
MSFKVTATIASFGGKLLKLTHNASTTGCEMALNLYLPPQATSNKSQKVPVIFYLAGLTCTGDNGAEKGFFQYGASQKGIAIVYPDTSPRKPPYIHWLAISNNLNGNKQKTSSPSFSLLLIQEA